MLLYSIVSEPLVLILFILCSDFCLQQKISLLDPSDIYRPDIAAYAKKDLDQFRDYSVVEDDPIKERVRQTYAQMHRNQTVAFVQGIFVDLSEFLHYLLA